MFKVNNKDARTTFTPCSSVSVINFEHVNADWVICALTVNIFTIYR